MDPTQNKQYLRRIIRITGDDSPNVRLARAEIASGLKPSGRVIVNGVLPWNDYVVRRATWDKVRQCVSLDAQFWEGADALLFPMDWLNLAEQRHLDLSKILINRLNGRPKQRLAKGIGVDTAEGGDDTCLSAVDEYGLIELVTMSTPNTGVIQGTVVDFIRKHSTPLKEQVWSRTTDRAGYPARLLSRHTCFDRGGGGKQIADALNRDMARHGWRVRTVGFGETVAPDPKRGTKSTNQQVEARDERYEFMNRRAQLYGTFREVLDPTLPHPSFPFGFALPPGKCGSQYVELRRQLAPIPLTRQREGRLYLIPKDKPTPTYTGPTLRSLLGCSPDEADSVTLAIHGMLTQGTLSDAGAATTEDLMNGDYYQDDGEGVVAGAWDGYDEEYE